MKKEHEKGTWGQRRVEMSEEEAEERRKETEEIKKRYDAPLQVAELPKGYSSVIFPTCERKDYLQFSTFAPNMSEMVQHVFAKGETFSLWDAQEAFACDCNAINFLEMARRFALFRRFPYFLYNSFACGMTYLADPESGKLRPLGETRRVDEDAPAEKGVFTISYQHTRHVWHIPLMLLGHVLYRTPGLYACRNTGVPIETALAERDAAEVGGELPPPQLTVGYGRVNGKKRVCFSVMPGNHNKSESQEDYTNGIS